MITLRLTQNWSNKLLRYCKTVSDIFLNLVLPPRCPMTGELVGEQGTLHPSFWTKLNFIHAPMCKICGTPFPHEVETGMVCTQCLQSPPSFQIMRSVWRYDDASASLILKFKHADALHLTPILGNFLTRAGTEILQGADLIIPVPLHRWRLIKRRYNQAGLLAKIISKNSGVPVATNLLRRIRATESQGHKNNAERQINMRSAFAISPDDLSLITGKNIILVDDVFTSGATIEECSKTLLAHGAAQIRVLCLAKICRD